jgi:hypothetical protein
MLVEPAVDLVAKRGSSSNLNETLRITPGDRAQKEMDEAMEAVRVAGDDLLGFSPMFATPTGATPKKLIDGTIDPDNCRPTADFSWPVWDVPLAQWVNSPNESIDLDSHPSLKWFSLQDFFDQVHYLRQFGVDLE